MGFLAKILPATSRLKFPAELSVLKCDMHSHFIPGIDDGVKTMEESIALIREFQKLGYKKIITTPHVLTDGYNNSSETILQGLEKVRVALKNEQISVHIEAAAEYYLDFDFERKMDSGKLLTFGNNFLLFEVSFLNPPEHIDRFLFKMLSGGYRPVLAHPERYPFWMENYKKFEELKEKGILLQLNMNSISGYYGPGARVTAEELIKRDLVDFLGSDCHRIKHVEAMRETRYYKWLHKLLESGRLLNSSL